MTLEELAQSIPDLTEWGHPDKIKLFGWFVQTQENNPRFHGADIARCYKALDLPKPSGFGGYFQQLEVKKEVLSDSNGHYLSRSVREGLTAKYGQRVISLQIAKMLETLPDQVPDLAERTFLDETISCLRIDASRAAIVMAWNLAYHHLCDYVLKSPQRLSDFNAKWPLVYQGHHRKAQKVITKMDDFGEELKESEVIEICNSAKIITGDQHKILKDKLGRRNSAAHPSSVKIGQLQAEEFIDDLVKNVVLKLV